MMLDYHSLTTHVLSGMRLNERDELEATSRRFAVKYLLGVMKSSTARDFLRANRRSNIHLCPGDWKNLPIHDVSPQQQQPIVALVEQILTAKRANPNRHGKNAAPDETHHARFPLPNPLPVMPSPQSSDGTTSHSTRLAKDASQVAGYPASGRGSKRKIQSLIPAGEGANESLREFHVSADITALESELDHAVALLYGTTP